MSASTNVSVLLRHYQIQTSTHNRKHCMLIVFEDAGASSQSLTGRADGKPNQSFNKLFPFSFVVHFSFNTCFSSSVCVCVSASVSLSVSVFLSCLFLCLCMRPCLRLCLCLCLCLLSLVSVSDCVCACVCVCVGFCFCVFVCVCFRGCLLRRRRPPSRLPLPFEAARLD